MIIIRINGLTHVVTADPTMPLLWFLRDTLGLTGTKYGCGIGVCGACTVHVDGVAARSCATAVGGLHGASVTTIEGLSGALLHPVQQAWLEEDVVQCGYCQPGQVMAAAALLARTPHPTDAEIDRALSGNICRCGTYTRIRAAVKRGAQVLRAQD
jgi:isoquinoline 1-oxidoreductase alpha subunit